MPNDRVTRGCGVLEGFLARKRTEMANRLIPPGCQDGRILDLGCGNHPYFLMQADVAEKYGLDRLERETLEPMSDKSIKLIDHDVHDVPLPFEDGYFDVVTMLAVFEHIEPANVAAVLGEIRRVLKPGGTYIITTPAAWTDFILRTMAKLGLISSEEIDEHINMCSAKEIHAALTEVGFAAGKIRQGTFELGMNLWVAAEK